MIDSTDRARASIAKVSLHASQHIQIGPSASSSCTGSAFVPDLRSRKSERVSERSVQNELFNLLDHEHLAEAAILIMANKQDLKDAMTVKEMSDVLALHSIKRHDWHIQVLPPGPHAARTTCAWQPDGLCICIARSDSTYRCVLPQADMGCAVLCWE